jgi:large subunit ribosomal protein L25
MKLNAQKRTVVGKKVRKLREEGIVPASLFGPKREAVSIQLNAKELKKAFEKSGYNKFVQLVLDDSKPVQVLIKEINTHPLTDGIVDASIYQIDEDRKVTVEIPIELHGESPAVKLKLGFLVQQLESVAVLCLPKDLPDQFDVDISSLEDTSDTISLSDLNMPEGVEFESGVDPHSAIAYIATDQKEIVEDEPVESEEGEEEGGESEEKSDEEGESSEETKSDE